MPPSVPKTKSPKKPANKENKAGKGTAQSSAVFGDEDIEDLSERIPPSLGRELQRTPVKTDPALALRASVAITEGEKNEPGKTPEKCDSASDGTSPEADPCAGEHARDDPYSPPQMIVRVKNADRYPTFTPSPRSTVVAKNIIPSGKDLPRTPFVPEEGAGQEAREQQQELVPELVSDNGTVDPPSLEKFKVPKAVDSSLSNSLDPHSIPTGTQLPRTPANPEELKAASEVRLPKGKYEISGEKPQDNADQSDDRKITAEASKKRKRSPSEEDLPKMVLEVPHVVVPPRKEKEEVEEKVAVQKSSENTPVVDGDHEDSVPEEEHEGAANRTFAKTPEDSPADSNPRNSTYVIASDKVASGSAGGASPQELGKTSLSRPSKVLKCLTKNRAPTPKRRPPSKRSSKPIQKVLEELEGRPEVLPSLTKNRVQTPKRRPPTRKGRDTAAADKDHKEDGKDGGKALKESESFTGLKNSGDGERTVLLECLTKNRAQTPKKRPPTKKGRKVVAEEKVQEDGDPVEAGEEGEEMPELYLSSSEEDGNGGALAAEESLDKVKRNEKTLKSLTKERAPSPKKRLPTKSRAKAASPSKSPSKKTSSSGEEGPVEKEDNKEKKSIFDVLFDKPAVSPKRDEEAKVVKKKKFRVVASKKAQQASEKTSSPAASDFSSPRKRVAELLELTKEAEDNLVSSEEAVQSPSKKQKKTPTKRGKSRRKGSANDSKERENDSKEKSVEIAKRPARKRTAGKTSDKVEGDVSLGKVNSPLCSPAKRGKKTAKASKGKENTTVVDETVKEAEPKKTRGRPKKVVEQKEEEEKGDNSSTSQVDASSTETPKRKRGRPRKVVAAEDEGKRKDDGTPAQEEGGKAGRNSKKKTQEGGETENGTVAEKKRDSKLDKTDVKSPAAPAEPAEQADEPAKAKGRRKKPLAKSQSEGAIVGQNGEVKGDAAPKEKVDKKKGAAGDESSSVLEDVSLSAPPKSRTRGRKKQEASAELNQESPAAAKNDVVEEKASKGKRGRKTKKTETELVSSLEESSLRQETPAGAGGKTKSSDRSEEGKKKPPARRGRRKADDTIVEESMEKLARKFFFRVSSMYGTCWKLSQVLPPEASLKLSDDVYRTPRVRLPAVGAKRRQAKEREDNAAGNAVLQVGFLKGNKQCCC